MNLQVLKRSRKKPEVGDVFAMLPSDGEYLYGMVMDLRSPWNDGGRAEFVAALVYIFRARSSEMLEIPTLSANDLLVGPMFTNNRPWTLGFAQTVESRSIGAADEVANLTFWDNIGKAWVDVDRKPAAEPPYTAAPSGLGNELIINYYVTKALGLPEDL